MANNLFIVLGRKDITQSRNEFAYGCIDSFLRWQFCTSMYQEDV